VRCRPERRSRTGSTHYGDVSAADVDDIAAHVGVGDPVTRLARDTDPMELRMAMWMTDEDFEGSD